MNPIPKHKKGKSDAVRTIDFIQFSPEKIQRGKKKLQWVNDLSATQANLIMITYFYTRRQLIIQQGEEHIPALREYSPPLTYPEMNDVRA